MIAQDARNGNTFMMGKLFMLIAFWVCTVDAQEYTLRDFVEESDLIVVAKIVSKKSERIQVRTPQPDGSISTGNPIFTRYKINVIEYFGPEKYRGEDEFLLPGGEIDNTIVSWTHTPELYVGMEIMLAMRHDRINNFFTVKGVPPIGRTGGLFISIKKNGVQTFAPYGAQELLNYAPTLNDHGSVKENVRPDIKMLDLINSSAIDYQGFLETLREVRNGN